MADPQGRGERVGNSKKSHPLPLRLRHVYVEQPFGGARGYRGPGWRAIREKVLARDKNRSTISGFDKAQGKGLQIDHIHPFRIGGKNKMSNLRVTDNVSNPYADHAAGSSEIKKDRDPRW